jgi:hypothetical protein
MALLRIPHILLLQDKLLVHQLLLLLCCCWINVPFLLLPTDQQADPIC